MEKGEKEFSGTTNLMPKGSKNANGNRVQLIIMQDICFEKTFKISVEFRSIKESFSSVENLSQHHVKNWKERCIQITITSAEIFSPRLLIKECSGFLQVQEENQQFTRYYAVVHFKLERIRNLHLEVWSSSFQFNLCSDMIVNGLVFASLYGGQP